MSDKKEGLRWFKYLIVGLAYAGVTLVQDRPSSIRLANALDTVSAQLSETLLNGAGISVERVGTRLQSTGQEPAFNLEFRGDGDWILKAFYLLLPMALLLSFVFDLSVWKVLLHGFVATAIGICIRAFLFGYNAAAWGEAWASGVLDDIIRAGVILFAMVSMVLNSARPFNFARVRELLDNIKRTPARAKEEAH